jgi:hypothetical protein
MTLPARTDYSRTTVSKELPIRSLQTDVGRAEPLVVAVVPFDQVWIDFGYVAEPGEFTGPARSLQGAGKHFGGIKLFQPLP